MSAFVAVDINLVYGTGRVIAGAALVVGGGVAEVTIPLVGQGGGTVGILYGVYQGGTGYARIVRCPGEQLLDVVEHPTVHKSPQQLLGDFAFGVTPSGNRLEDWQGGLP